MSSKKKATKKKEEKVKKSTSSKKDTTKSTPKKKTPSKTPSKSKKSQIPDEWKTEPKEGEQEKGKRRSLISTLKRSITIKGGDKGVSTLKDPMNIVITLSPAKHVDIIEYIEDTVPAGGRAEWVRDSIRLKMRIEKGVYGLNTTGQNGSPKESEEALQAVFGQFAEVMSKMMTDLKTPQQTTSSSARPLPPPSRPTTPRERTSGGPPQLKKIESEEAADELKPDRPSLDDAIGAIIIVE
ncbi:MAG: hypothetical protein ACTSPK_00650 [Candidatus Heimdallarchaeota archaeon]